MIIVNEYIDLIMKKMMKLAEETNADEITYGWELRDGRRISLCFRIYSGDDEEVD